MRAVRLSTAVGPHVGRCKGVSRASISRKLGQNTNKNASETPQKRLRRFTPHPNMIGPIIWVPWTTVGSSTTSAVVFPRLRGPARQGAFSCKSRFFQKKIYNFDAGKIPAHPLHACGEPHGLFLKPCPRPAPPTVWADTNAGRAPL